MKLEYRYPKQVKNKATGEIMDFDPVNNPLHAERLIRNFHHSNPEHPDAKLDGLDADRCIAFFVDQTVSMAMGDGDRRPYQLAANECTPTAGDRLASKIHDRYPGFELVEFHPYEGTAVIERLDPDRLRVRGIMAAELKTKPYLLQARPAGKGWDITMDPSVTYLPVRDDPAANRAATRIGQEGWHARTDTMNHVIHVIPGTPPTFLPSHPYPFDQLKDSDGGRTRFGVWLPESGDQPYEDAVIDWRESPFVLIGGEPGSGKSVCINAILATLIAAGDDLSIIDLNNKATDYYWTRPWVTPGHWGCESDVQGAGVLNRLIEDIEHGERAKVWKENAWQNWYEIPDWAKRKYPRHTVVVDEFSSLVDKAAMTRTIPKPDKTLPAVFRAMFMGQAQYDIKYAVQRLVRTARAQGYRLILASQTVNQQSGLGPTIRDLFGHRIIMGASPSASVLGTLHDQKSMPDVPGRVKDDPRISKGVGVGEINGARPRIFKTFWAGHDGMGDVQALATALVDAIGVPDGVDASAFLDTLAKHGPDNPVDGQVMNALTERIDLPYQTALASDETLAALKEGWDDSKLNFGGDQGSSQRGDNPSKPVADGPKDAGADLMDASRLADLLGA